MKNSLRVLTLMAGIAAMTAMIGAQEQRSRPQGRTGPAERSLLGISLFDTGLKVINKFGSPDEIQAIGIGATAAIGGGGSGAPGLGNTPSFGGGRNMGSGSRGPTGGPATPGGKRMPGANTPAAGFATDGIPLDDSSSLPGFVGNPFGTASDRQAGPPPGFRPPSYGNGPGGRGASGPGGGSYGPPAGIPGIPPGVGNGNGRTGMGGGASVPGTGGMGQSNRVTVTRWVYNRGMSRYAFILDKFNRVIQIEAVGIQDPKVSTRKGVRFGSSFSSLIKNYKAPDGYEIAGNNIVVRYLVYDRVAFRLQKIDPKKPHVVTGIVVAAGKM